MGRTLTIVVVVGLAGCDAAGQREPECCADDFSYLLCEPQQPEVPADPMIARLALRCDGFGEHDERAYIEGTLTEELAAITAVRGTRPTDYGAMNTGALSLALKANDGRIDTWLAGSDEAFACIDHKYGPEHQREAGVLSLYFDAGFLDHDTIRADYIERLGLEPADVQPNALGGDGDWIHYDLDARVNRYLFVLGSGDCQGGCINEDYELWYVDMRSDLVELHASWHGHDAPADAYLDAFCSP